MEIFLTGCVAEVIKDDTKNVIGMSNGNVVSNKFNLPYRVLTGVCVCGIDCGL